MTVLIISLRNKQLKLNHYNSTNNNIKLSFTLASPVPWQDVWPLLSASCAHLSVFSFPAQSPIASSVLPLAFYALSDEAVLSPSLPTIQLITIVKSS